MAILRQQVDSLTASRESLLTAYNQEQAMVTSLEQQIKGMRDANKVNENIALILSYWLAKKGTDDKATVF